ncbi:MAG: tRNA lysidine(34) synthetase TilS, partial [Myxococcota bacterium]
AIGRYGLLERGDRVVVAVSGGPDSMALAHALCVMAPEGGWEVHAAHLHHGLRGRAADEDLALVEAWAAREKVPLTVERLGPDALAGPGVEARARTLRYEFLRRVAAQAGAARIATGHTMDDQAETVLLRLLRGSGTRGLAGIQPKRPDGVIRPLLLAMRAEVLTYLAGAGVAYGDDETNTDPRFLRNRVRHEVLPLLRSLSPRITERLASLAERMRADEAYLAAETGRLGTPWLEKDRGGAAGAGNAPPAADREQLLKLPEAIRSRVLLALLAEAGAPPDRLADVIDRIEAHLAPEVAPGSLDLGGDLQVRWDSRGLTVAPAAGGASGAAERGLTVPGLTPLPGGRAIRATILDDAAGEGGDTAGAGTRALFDEARVSAEGPKAAGEADPARASFDLDALALPLRVRTRRAGDRMRPRGFDHRRKLKDVLIDAGVPRDARDGVPLVLDGEEIIWAAGVRASERGRPAAGTARRLLLALVEDPAGGPEGGAAPRQAQGRRTADSC